MTVNPGRRGIASAIKKNQAAGKAEPFRRVLWPSHESQTEVCSLSALRSQGCPHSNLRSFVPARRILTSRSREVVGSDNGWRLENIDP